MRITGSVFAIRRMVTMEIEANKALATPTNATGLKTLGPGFRIRTTPRNPSRINTPVCLETGSFNQIRAIRD